MFLTSAVEFSHLNKKPTVKGRASRYLCTSIFSQPNPCRRVLPWLMLESAPIKYQVILLTLLTTTLFVYSTAQSTVYKYHTCLFSSEFLIRWVTVLLPWTEGTESLLREESYNSLSFIPKEFPSVPRWQFSGHLDSGECYAVSCLLADPWHPYPAGLCPSLSVSTVTAKCCLSGRWCHSLHQRPTHKGEDLPPASDSQSHFFLPGEWRAYTFQTYPDCVKESILWSVTLSVFQGMDVMGPGSEFRDLVEEELKKMGAHAEALPGLWTSKVQTCCRQHVKGGQVTIMMLDIVNHSRLKLLAITCVWLL